MVHEMNQMHKIISNEMLHGHFSWPATKQEKQEEQQQLVNSHEQNDITRGRPDVIVRCREDNKWTPFKAFEKDPLFSNVLTEFNPPNWIQNPIDKTGGLISSSSVKEVDNNYVVNVPIDDFPKENINFNYNKDTGLFSVEGEQVVEESDGSKFSSKFTRSISIAPNLNMKGVEPKFENGVLKLSLQKPAIEGATKATKKKVNDDDAKQ